MYHETRGHALRELARLDDAIAAFRTAVRLNPRLASTHYNLGLVQQAADQPERAVENYRRALRIEPGMMLAQHNLGVVLSTLGRLNDAEAAFRGVLQVRPNDVEARFNLGAILRDQGRLEEALDCLSGVLRDKPGHTGAALNIATVHLMAGRLEQGWKAYDAVGPSFGSGPRFAEPVWKGEDALDRVLLVYRDGGLGDFLHFCRFVPLAMRHARVVLEVPLPLVRLMGSLDGVRDGTVRLVPAGEDPPEFDLISPVTHLPQALGTTMATIPADVPYLLADPSEIAVWRDRLSVLPGLRVGLAWAGNRSYAQDRLRSLDPALLVHLSGTPGVSFVSLQTERREGVPHALGLHDWTEELHDMAATAALISALDLVIGVDSSVAHLAGALGRPVWLLNRFHTEWRWMRDRDDSPWYPTMRIFRQPAPGDWRGVLTGVAAALTRQAAR
jgi:hypothetical protein